MKNRPLIIILCITLITLQFLSGFVFANVSAETSVTTPPVEDKVSISANLVLEEGKHIKTGDKVYIEPLSNFYMEYDIIIQNGKNIEITEELFSKNSSTPKYSRVRDHYYEAGQHLVNLNANYSGDLGESPYTVKYEIKYQVNGVEEIFKGNKVINVIDTRIQTTYSVQHTSPVFKGQDVTYKVDVEQRALGENVTLKNLIIYNVNVQNNTEVELGRIPELAPGAKKTITKAISLDKTTETFLKVVYDDPLKPGTKLEYRNNSDRIKVEVSQDSSVASMKISGESDKPALPAEGEVEFAIKVQNSGNTGLVNIEFVDWDGKVFDTKEVLNSGDEYTAYYKAVAKPGGSYDFLVRATTDGSGQKIQSNHTISIQSLEPQIEINRTFNPEVVKAGEAFTIHYEIKNVGNVALKNIVIKEPEFGEIYTHNLLEVNGIIGFSKEFTINEDSYSKTVFTAVDDVASMKYEYEATSVDIMVELPEGTPSLSVLLSSDIETLSKAGIIELECIIKNTGTVPLYNIELFLTEGGMAIDTISTLEPGDDRTINIPATRVEKTETFTVTVTGLDEEGNPVSFESNELTISISKAQTSGMVRALRIIFVVIIVLILAIAFTLFYLIKGPFRLPFKRKRKHYNA